MTAEDAASNPRGSTYYIVELEVGQLRRHGIEVAPRPLPDQPGHAEISSLTWENRKSTRSKEIMVQLAHELSRLVGCFPEE